METGVCPVVQWDHIDSGLCSMKYKIQVLDRYNKTSYVNDVTGNTKWLMCEQKSKAAAVNVTLRVESPMLDGFKTIEVSSQYSLLQHLPLTNNSSGKETTSDEKC